METTLAITHHLGPKRITLRLLEVTAMLPSAKGTQSMSRVIQTMGSTKAMGLLVTFTEAPPRMGSTVPTTTELQATRPMLTSNSRTNQRTSTAMLIPNLTETCSLAQLSWITI